MRPETDLDTYCHPIYGRGVIVIPWKRVSSSINGSRSTGEKC